MISVEFSVNIKQQFRIETLVGNSIGDEKNIQRFY